MKILFPAVRVSDLETSLAFYEAIGMEAVGRVVHVSTRMAMLALPGEDDVILELVQRTDAEPGSAGGLDHLAIQVDDLEATRRELLAAGLDPSEVQRPGGADGPRTVTLVDPDGHHLELVQWPDRHPVAMTRADFADPNEENDQ
jgi:lactoylglutathione lyase